MVCVLQIIFFLLFAKDIFACSEDYEKKPVRLAQPRQEYDEYIGYQYVYTEEKTFKSTITCTNISSIKEISYSYQEQEYEQLLRITESNIPEIHILEFSKFRTITKLYLNQLQIEIISPGAFSGLTRLQELYLNDNKLTELLTGVYNSLNRLEVLNLTNNHIQIIDETCFMGVGNLVQLYLKNNNISIIEEGTFKNSNHLKTLDVSKNPLEEISLDELSNIETLLLSETSLSQIDDDLSNLTIKVFNLSSCQISKIDFIYFPKLDTIDLSYNEIESLENCQSLEAVNINLTHNQIKTLNGTFNDISLLYLSHNEITVLDKLSDSLNSFLILDFSYNKIISIRGSFFQNFTSLHTLSLQHNKISKIDPVLFRDLTSLRTLDLSDNQIKDFQYGTFDNLKSLEILNISHNKLMDLHQYTFNSLSNLQSLFFDNNQISSLEVKDLKNHLPRLLTVSLDQNSWNCKDLVKIDQFFKESEINIIPGSSYDVDNFHGIVCSNSKKFEISTNVSSVSVKDVSRNFQQAINNGIEDSKMKRFFNEEFDKSKFFQYFDKDYSQSNFFKYLDNYKFAVAKQQELNESHVEKLTALQVPLDEPNHKIVVFGVVILVFILILLIFLIFIMFTFVKKITELLKPVNSSQIELC